MVMVAAPSYEVTGGLLPLAEKNSRGQGVVELTGPSRRRLSNGHGPRRHESSGGQLEISASSGIHRSSGGQYGGLTGILYGGEMAVLDLFGILYRE
jgi:hypothetical protein